MADRNKPQSRDFRDAPFFSVWRKRDVWLTDTSWTTELGGCRQEWRGRPHLSSELKYCVDAYAKKRKTWCICQEEEDMADEQWADEVGVEKWRGGMGGGSGEGGGGDSVA